MGGCLQFRPPNKLDFVEESHDSWDSSEISEECHSSSPRKQNEFLSSSESSLLAADPGISQLVRYFSSEKAIAFSSDGVFSAAGDYMTTSHISTTFALPMTNVTEQLYFGSFEDAKNEIELRAIGITHMISLIGPKHLIDGIEHKHSPMNDYGRTDLNRLLKKLWPFIKESQKINNKLFVHCMSGQNRSATLVIAILMKKERLSLCHAFRVVKTNRPVIQINERYAKQLSKMELELFNKNSVPGNWMEISSVDMETGKVCFSGENLCAPAGSVGHLSNIVNRSKHTSMASLGRVPDQLEIKRGTHGSTCPDLKLFKSSMGSADDGNLRQELVDNERCSTDHKPVVSEIIVNLM